MFASLNGSRSLSRYCNYVTREQDISGVSRVGGSFTGELPHPTMKLHLSAVLAFPFALALAVSATIPTSTGSGRGPEIDAGSGNTRSDQRIALAALDPVINTERPCVFRGSYCDPQVPCCARYQYWYGNVSGAASGRVNSVFERPDPDLPLFMMEDSFNFVVVPCVTP